MKKNLYLLLGILMVLTSCEVVTPGIRNEKTPVIRAFIMPQSDTLSVSVRFMIAYSASEDDTVQLPVSNIPVYLIHGSDSLLMAENQKEPGNYILTSGSLNLQPGDTIRLFGVYGETLFRSSTVIPEEIESLAISSSSLYYTVGDPRSMLSSAGLTVSWDNKASDFYYVVVENTETDPEPLNEMVADMPVMSFAMPSQADQFVISMRNIRYFGDHRVVIYHVNPEYADLFDNGELTSNAITRPPGNVDNAMGIFTALTTDTVFFTVYKQ
jgi:hypothetical protein